MEAWCTKHPKLMWWEVVGHIAWMRESGERGAGSQQEGTGDESNGNMRLLQRLVELQPGVL